MIELEKKQAKINYATTEADQKDFNDILEKASQILNRKYLKYNLHTASEKVFIGVEVEGLKYSALSMSAGEQKIFHILKIVYNAPKNSLVLIDELDLLLHDKAMASLIRVIFCRANEKSLQVIFTTHRESVIGLSDFVNIRHLLSTSTKTLCFNDTYPDAINRLTGSQPKSLDVFVEDDLSSAIVSKISSDLGGRRHVSIHRFGAAINCFTAASGLLFGNQDISNSLFVLDGDVYVTENEKKKNLDRLITGTDQLAKDYKDKALQVIKQYRLPSVIKPELFLHGIICKIENVENPEHNEIIETAKSIHVEEESHKYIDSIIDRIGFERNVGLSKIVDLLSTTSEWVDYVADINEWLADKIRPLIEPK